MLLYICRCIYLLYVDGGTWSAIYVWESCRASFIISLLLVWYLCTKYLFAFAIFILSHYEHMYLN